jgi:hypothetical protein
VSLLLYSSLWLLLIRDNGGTVGPKEEVANSFILAIPIMFSLTTFPESFILNL